VARVVVLQVIARMNLGGTSKYILKLSKELEAIGIKSPIATGYVQKNEIEDPDLKKIRPIRIKHLGRKISPINDLKAMNELRNIIIKVKPDVIHTHTFKAGFIARVQRNKIEEKLGKKVKFIHTFHGHLFDDPEFNGLKKQIITFVERYLSRRTDQLITGGINVKRDLEKKKIYGTVKSVSISPAIERQSLLSKKESFNRFKIKSKSRFRVLWLARVTYVKNPGMLVLIAKSLPEFDFYMVGSGDLFRKIKALAPGNLKILGWQDINNVLPIADVFLSTSSNEGIPIAFMQAQLAGVPIVTTNVGSVSEVVIHNKTGFLCDNSSQQLIAALRLLENNDNLRNRLSKAAKINILKKFSTKKFIIAHLRVYQRD
jgi:glycosyltransferase involved in cell wall biosynthesis